VVQDWLDKPIVFVAIFVAFWIAIGYLISTIGGWRSLAALYATDAGQFTGTRWSMQSGAMRWTTHYNNVLTIGADSRGMYLAVMFLFRGGHPPLYIPWDGIEISERRGWIFSNVVFTFKSVPGVHLTVSKKLGLRVAREAGRPVAGEHAWLTG
jgi:hypothetical protein